jgi:RNA polymerase sigma factor (sigma-70 family)
MNPLIFERANLESMLVELRPKLHRYCARITGSVIDGEDVVQETFLKALQAVDECTAVEKPEQWLFRIAHNASQDHLRKRSREASRAAETDVGTIEDPSSTADARLIAATGLYDFMHLSVSERCAVLLADLLGFSLHEVGEITGATVPATKAALHRGRTRLKLLASETAHKAALTLDADGERRLRRYVDLFNERDFDGVRALIADDIQLEVVNRTRMRGKADVSKYFSNYDRAHDWTLSLGFVEGGLAILVRDPKALESGVRNFMLIDWDQEQVARIRDFRYASYCMLDADICEAATV